MVQIDQIDKNLPSLGIVDLKKPKRGLIIEFGKQSSKKPSWANIS